MDSAERSRCTKGAPWYHPQCRFDAEPTSFQTRAAEETTNLRLRRLLSFRYHPARRMPATTGRTGSERELWLRPGSVRRCRSAAPRLQPRVMRWPASTSPGRVALDTAARILALGLKTGRSRAEVRARRGTSEGRGTFSVWPREDPRQRSSQSRVGMRPRISGRALHGRPSRGALSFRPDCRHRPRQVDVGRRTSEAAG